MFIIIKTSCIPSSKVKMFPLPGLLLVDSSTFIFFNNFFVCTSASIACSYLTPFLMHPGKDFICMLLTLWCKNHREREEEWSCETPGGEAGAHRRTDRRKMRELCWTAAYIDLCSVEYQETNMIWIDRVYLCISILYRNITKWYAVSFYVGQVYVLEKERERDCSAGERTNHCVQYTVEIR